MYVEKKRCRAAHGMMMEEKKKETNGSQAAVTFVTACSLHIAVPNSICIQSTQTENGNNQVCTYVVCLYMYFFLYHLSTCNVHLFMTIEKCTVIECRSLQICFFHTHLHQTCNFRLHLIWNLLRRQPKMALHPQVTLFPHITDLRSD